jgi:ACR3 family arsenite transporter
MMYPVLAKVRYDDIGHVTSDRRMIATSLVLNWVVGPALMFTLAWTFLSDLPEYRTGLIIVGLARCIAMVLIWNDLAGGEREAAAVLVALNSLFQIAAYSLLGYFYLELLPGWLGLEQSAVLDRLLDGRGGQGGRHLPGHPPRRRLPHPPLG